MDLLCFCSVLCLLCLCARLFICALWSPAGKGLTSWLIIQFSKTTCGHHYSWDSCLRSIVGIIIHRRIVYDHLWASELIFKLSMNTCEQKIC